MVFVFFNFIKTSGYFINFLSLYLPLMDLFSSFLIFIIF